MAGIDLTTASARLSEYLTAESAVLRNQSFTIDHGGSRRSLTRANLAEIREGISYWSGIVSRLEAASQGRRRSRYMAG